MNSKENTVAIIGSGATTIYFLKHLLDHIQILKKEINRIVIFEKDTIIGMGMPYSPHTTDKYNLANISSEEIPALGIGFADWLKQQEDEYLKNYGIAKNEINESEVYSRLALGAYFNSQYVFFRDELNAVGIEVTEHPSEEIVDVVPEQARYEVVTRSGKRIVAHNVIIATGHEWKEEDSPNRKFFASPWPIQKILPRGDALYNFPVGILGASLSAFDVVSSLAHRHGTFYRETDTIYYLPFEGAEKFKLVLHDANGWLPHLQYEQDEPMRQIYRHVKRDHIFELLDATGLLRIESFFDQICKPALQCAFRKDDLEQLASLLDNQDFGLKEFVERMSGRHEYKNAFEGMKVEMVEAKDSVENKRPIHWKEVIDDLMYCLNYHAELMPAEDHIFFRKVVMPFLMNVIAALPLSSGNILLALYNSGTLDLKSGMVRIQESQPSDISTKITLDSGNHKGEYAYNMFVCCGGQRNTEWEHFPFPTLVEKGKVRAAKAIFAQERSIDSNSDHIFEDKGKTYLLTGGIDIDASYRIIGENGVPSKNLFDISFTHTSGIRPYSYGLQACSTTTEIMVQSWANAIKTGNVEQGELKEVTKVYRDNPSL